MEFKNHKITEALCAFHFDTSKEDEWNVGKFADFFKKIEIYGFSESQQIKPKHFQIELNQGIPKYQQTEGELKILYQSKDNTQASIMSQGYVSFHALQSYNGWEFFLPNTQNILEAYQSIKLGKSLKKVQMIYINTFQIGIEENVSDYATFVPEIRDFEQGREVGHNFQSSFKIGADTDLVVTTLCNSELNHKNIQLIIDCTVAINTTNDWQKAMNNAHDICVKFFKNIVTTQFQQKIK
jgi:uncharacterized protein (TIGR04255 family)